jgi:hypothetical protein
MKKGLLLMWQPMKVVEWGIENMGVGAYPQHKQNDKSQELPHEAVPKGLR